MPNKKSKSNASKGKAPTSSEAMQASSSNAHTPTSATPHVAPSLPPPSWSDDFWTKNARAKALIMSTLVPGSEPWEIAEPLELASDIWKALEDKYAPKDGNLKLKSLKNPKTSDGAADRGEEPGHSSPASDFIGDWVEGKPMDKYLEIYKAKLAKAQSGAAQSNLEESTGWLKPSDVASMAEHVHKGVESTHSADMAEDQNASHPAVSSASSERWRATPVKHDSYLSESQALTFAQNDVERKKQIQVAATKVLMQKLPIRDLRFLWAVLYGGENAPWPGSCSAVIPGVTTSTWNGKTYEAMNGTWTSNIHEKG